MTRRGFKLWIAAGCLAALGLTQLASDHRASAADVGYPPGHEDLFYNFYRGPGHCGGVPTRMYLAPRPTPPWVGHTYITYQPFMPHEFLYTHKRQYTRYHGDGGLTRTRVDWHSPGGGLLHALFFAL